MSPGVTAMLEAVAVSGSAVKSQQIGDADLTLDQRREALLQQYQSKPLVFLERYQVRLSCGRSSPLGKATLFIEHVSYTRQAQSASHSPRTHQWCVPIPVLP